MTLKSCLITIALVSCSWAYAANNPGSIGTVSARGDLRVDGFTVPSNGTLFDGSAVATSQASATLRLDSGTEITLARNSQGIVHKDRLVLLQGQGQVKATNTPYMLEADGLLVKPGTPNGVGFVSVGGPDSVEVAALSGEVLIVDNAGMPLMHVAPGTAMSLHQATSSTPTLVTEIGMVSQQNGQYYLTTVDGTRYLLLGKDFHKYVGDKVIVTGKLMGQPGTEQILVNSININGETGILSSHKFWLATLLLGGGAGAGIAIYEATKPAASNP